MRFLLPSRLWMLSLMTASAVQAADLTSQAVAPLSGSSSAPVYIDQRYGNAELLLQVQQLQTEMQSLREQLEQQGQVIRQLQKDSRDRYIDVDRRLLSVNNDLNSLKRGSSTVSAADAESEGDSVNATIASSPVSSSAKDAYQNAYALVRSKQFDQAISAYQAFIKNYPDSALLPNAYYWLGELYMVKNLTQEAERVFNAVVEQYPKSRKTPDARYKLGLVYARYGQQDKAKKQMESVKALHPDSTAAKLAEQYLQSAAK